MGAALILAMSVTGIVAMLVERFVLRPLVGRPVFVTIIVTLYWRDSSRLYHFNIWE